MTDDTSKNRDDEEKREPEELTDEELEKASGGRRVSANTAAADGCVFSPTPLIGSLNDN